MKNQDLLKLKIEIQNVDSDISFQELAIFVDKPDFLFLLKQLRDELNITKLYPLTNDKGWGGDYYFFEHGEVYDEKSKINLNKYKRLPLFQEKFPEKYEELRKHVNSILDLKVRMDIETTLFCFEFGRPNYVTTVVEQATFCGALDGKYCFQPTKAISLDEIIPIYSEFRLPQFAILISPYSTEKDVIWQLYEAKKIIKKDSNYSYYRPRLDTHVDIKKQREWYWVRLGGKTYKEITDYWCDKYSDDKSVYDENYILRAIKRYEELLTIS